MSKIKMIGWVAAWLVVTPIFAPMTGADTEIRRPIPGTDTPDYGGPLYIERNGIVYPAIPGTRTPDYRSDDRRIIRDGKVYDAIPGTNTPDYGSGQWLLRER
jgi:hypothetical protein